MDGENGEQAGKDERLARFLDREGRVAIWPSRQRDRIAVLEHLVAGIPTGRRFSEREINALLNDLHIWHDPAFLRRSLFDMGLLDRTPNGAEYWRVETPR